MQFTVRVEQQENNGFTATLVGDDLLSRSASSRNEAVELLAHDIRQSLGRGELQMIEVDAKGAMSVFGSHADDPTLDDIVNEAYRERDAERPQ